MIQLTRMSIFVVKGSALWLLAIVTSIDGDTYQIVLPPGTTALLTGTTKGMASSKAKDSMVRCGPGNAHRRSKFVMDL